MKTVTKVLGILLSVMYILFLTSILCVAFMISIPTPNAATINSMPMIQAKMKTIEVYGTKSCPYCIKAISLLNKKGVPYTYYDIGSDTDKYIELIKRLKVSDTNVRIPAIFIDGKYIGGYNELVQYSMNRGL